MSRVSIPSYLLELLFARHYFAIQVGGLPPAAGLGRGAKAGQLTRPDLQERWLAMWEAGLAWSEQDGSPEKLFWGFAVPEAPLPAAQLREWKNDTRQRLANATLKDPPKGALGDFAEVLLLPLAGGWDRRLSDARIAVSEETWNAQVGPA